MSDLATSTKGLKVTPPSAFSSLRHFIISTPQEPQIQKTPPRLNLVHSYILHLKDSAIMQTKKLFCAALFSTISLVTAEPAPQLDAETTDTQLVAQVRVHSIPLS